MAHEDRARAHRGDINPRPPAGRQSPRRVGRPHGRAPGRSGLLAPALGELMLTIVINGEPLRQDLVERLSAMGESTAATTYHQPDTKIGMAFHWAGDYERARPVLERAAQRALSRG